MTNDWQWCCHAWSVPHRQHWRQFYHLYFQVGIKDIREKNLWWWRAESVLWARTIKNCLDSWNKLFSGKKGEGAVLLFSREQNPFYRIALGIYLTSDCLRPGIYSSLQADIKDSVMLHMHCGASNPFFLFILLGLRPLVLVELHWHRTGIT